MADLFDGYPLGDVWDEMFADAGVPRPAYSGLYAAVQPIDGEELAARADLLSQTYRDAGVTFAHAGEEQPFPLDIVPRLIGADEWAVIERGVTQRVQALEAFLADVYGPGQVFTDRVVPRNVVTTSAHFHRQAHGLVPPGGVRVHVCSTGCSRARCSPPWSRPRRAWPNSSAPPSATPPGSASPGRRIASSAAPARCWSS